MLLSDKINQQIPLAMNYIKNALANSQGDVPKEYESYLNAFGMALRNSGLLPTLIFYSKGQKSQDSTKILDGIYFLIKGNMPESKNALIMYVIDNAEKNNIEVSHTDNSCKGSKLSSFKVESMDDAEEQISEAVLALKLAIRTFNLVKQ